MLVEDLTEIDYQIIEFISRYEPVGIDVIRNKLHNITSLELRIEMLSTPERHQAGRIVLPAKNTCFVVEKCEYSKDELGCQTATGLQIYSATDIGKKVLQDYKTNKRKDKKELWLKNAWIPILVSAVTTLIVNWLPTMLLWIQQWFASFQ